MCGRFALRRPDLTWQQLCAQLDGLVPPGPRYNIAPGSQIVVVRGTDDGPRAGLMKWGFRPRWLKDPGKVMINARSESAAEKPMFREAFRRRRCLVPADGWYEWRREGAAKQPWFFHLADDRPFTFAGIWTTWEDAGGEQHNCALLTTEPSALAGLVHDRMPVIIEPANQAEWLGESGEGRVRFLCRPYLRADLVVHPVATRVNSPANDDEACVAPVGEALAPP